MIAYFPFQKDFNDYGPLKFKCYAAGSISLQKIKTFNAAKIDS